MSVLKTDGADIAYDDLGEGSPPLLLLHGFSCARTDFARQIDAFAERHRIIAFDQRGHGDSSLASDGRYGFDATADDARRLCAELGVTEPVVVGHSLGGVSALALANDAGFASALVLLDSTVELPPDVDRELAAYSDHLATLSDNAFADEIRTYARGRMIDPSDDPTIADDLVERAATVPKEAYVPGVRSIVGVDVASLAKAVEIPTLFIASSLPWLPPARVHELCPTWHIGRTVGAGHFHHLLVPDQVNTMIRRFLDAVDAGFRTTAPSEW